MSEDQKLLPPAEEPAPASQPARDRSLWWTVAHPAMVIAVLALGLLGWQWFETRARLDQLQVELAKRLAQSEEAANEARVLGKHSQELVQALTAKVGALDASLAESQSHQAALEAMYQELSRSRDERVLAEVEQAVSIAAQQLQLAGNVEAALIALQGADARLATADRAQFLPLRKVLGRDIERLKALPMADVPGVAVRLESIIEAVDTLPLAFEAKPRSEAATTAASDADKGFWLELANDLWSEIRQLVRVERMDRPDPGLLAPANVFFLRENLKLRLINARLALLQRDGRMFREDVKQAREWLERYFDPRAKAVQNAVVTLDQLSGIHLALNLPSLEDSLTALRNYKLARDQASGR